MALPTLSVVISTYNDLALVDKKLAELSQQTIFEEVEFIFVETGSPQREREALQPFCQRHRNCQLIAIDARESLFAAWNRGWEAASGDWLCYTNMDDCMHPELLRILRLQVAEHEWDLCSVLIAKQNETDPERDRWHPARFRRLPLSTRPGPFTAWRRDLMTDFGRFDSALKGAGDKDFWARAQSYGLRIGIIEQVLYLYTKGAGQLSKQGEPIGEREILEGKPYPMQWPKGYASAARRNSLLLRVYPGWRVPPVGSDQR